MAPVRTFLCLSTVSLPLLLPSLAQGPSPCPNEGETEIAKAGRTRALDDCSVTHWSFYGKVGLSGTLEIVTAGTEGAILYEHTTDANCAYQVSSFPDQLSVCQELPVANAWCKTQAYKVIEKRWETAEIGPCPNNDPISAILEYILHGEWPGCGKLLPVTPLTHWSAQQLSYGVATPEETQYGSYGQFELATGSPQACLPPVQGTVSTPEEQALQALMGSDDPAWPEGRLRSGLTLDDMSGSTRQLHKAGLVVSYPLDAAADDAELQGKLANLQRPWRAETRSRPTRPAARSSALLTREKAIRKYTGL